MAVEWLIDKSVLSRLQLGQVAHHEEWVNRITRGLVHISSVTLLELGFSARNGDTGRRAFTSPPLALMPSESITPAIERRALDVQMLLADRGQHRSASIPDLLIAATAELHHLTVLAVDKDFELIADITGQPVERPLLVSG